MSITEIVRAAGSWSVQLSTDTPQHVVDMLDSPLGRYGRIVVDAARDNPRLLGDNLLPAARYVGVLHQTSQDDTTGVALSGQGMSWWLGDPTEKLGDGYETEVAFTGASFAATIAGLLPDAITAGTITAPSGGGSYTGKHQWQVPREAIDYVCDLFGCDWRVNGDATMDAGPPEDLFVTTPQAAIVARVEGGDQNLRGLRGTAKLDKDVTDFSTRVVTLAQGQGRSVQVGSADIAPGLNVYRDPQGNPVKLTRFVSESNTSLTNADARAQVALNQYTTPRTAVTLSTDTHDIRGDLAAGDSVWVYDPDAGLVDTSNQQDFRGDRIYPVKLRVFQLTWSLRPGMGVYFRDTDGEWWDLTDWVVWENTGQDQVTVGGYDRALTNAGTEPVGSRVVADDSVPGVVPLDTPFTTSVYQSTGGASKARIIVSWSQPLNSDGTAIVDGDHYDIQYRTPAGSGQWTTQAVGFDQTQGVILELTPATEYGIRVRAVDTASPPNYGDWSDEEVVVSAGDTIAPATPAAPEVAGNPVSIQILHTLGRASGGTYNLDSDMHHLEVHASETGAGFTVDETTKIGEVPATAGMMSATVPAIGSFTVASTSTLYVKVVAVDESGNRSAASAAATATASLIDSAHISDLVASKISTGNLNAVLALVGAIQTGASGARWRADQFGWRTFRPSGTLALWNDSGTGDLLAYRPDGTTLTFWLQASTGNVTLFKSDGTTTALKLTASTGLLELSGKVTAGAGVGAGRTIIVDPTGDSGTNPAITLYPSSSTNRILVRALNDSTPGGTSAPSYQVLSLSSANKVGGALQIWDTGSAIVHRTDTLGATPNYTAVVSAQQSQGAVTGVINGTSTFEGYYQVTPDANLVMSPGSGGEVVIFGPTGISQFYITSAGEAVLQASATNYIQATPSGSTVVSNGTVKSFVIDHPTDSDRLLVHACTESPASAVEYAGKVEVTNGEAVVELPAYFEALTHFEGRSVLLTPELAETTVARPDGTTTTMPMIPQAAPTAIENGRFRIVCPAPDGTKVNWRVYAVRKDIPQFDVEPLRADVDVRGDGPYRYIATPPA